MDLELGEGEFSRVDWATGQGTATLDHFVTAGSDAEGWRTTRTRLVRAAGAGGTAGRLLWDHVLAVVRWSTVSEERGVAVHAWPNFKVE